MSPPNQRLGQVLFTGEKANDLRAAAFREVRAILVIAGGEGAAAEVAQAQDIGLGIVPLALSGGTAATTWERLNARFADYRLGGKPVGRLDFDLLRDSNAGIASTAAVRLLRQALFLS